MEEPPSSSKTRDGDSEFEEVWSELHTLKKLYAILHKNSANTPNGDNTHETLDEKSRLLLKKLLDSATHQALQSQTKIVFSSPSGMYSSEPKISTEDGLHKEMIVPEKVPECHAAPVHKDQHKLTCPKVSSGPDQPQAAKSGRLPVAKPLISQKTSPLLELKPQTSIKSTKSSNQKPQRHIDHNRNRDHSSSKLRPTGTKSIVHVPPNHVVNPTVHTRTRQVDGGDLMAAVPVPAQKRARVEAKATSQTRIDGRVDRELTHSKRAELVAGRARKPVSRIGSLNNRTATKSTAKIDQGKKRTDRMKKNSSRGTSSCASNKGRIMEPPAKHPPIRTRTYESASRTTSSSSGTYIASLPRRLPARAVPTRRQPHRTEAGPPRKKAEENKEGKMARFKNKLAIIFHHHHHHHHIHDGHADGPVGSVDNGGTRQHRSPWKYLRGIQHRKSDGGRAKHAKAVARAPARRGQIGYFHALLEGLVRHVWGMRRKKVAENRLGPAKKLHWWQRFRRRGGVRVANKKKARVRIGFSRANSRITGKKLA